MSDTRPSTLRSLLVAVSLLLGARPLLAEPGMNSAVSARDNDSAISTCDAAAALVPPAVMLASLPDEALDPAKYWVSEKLDGVRARWDGCRLISRGGELIHAPEWFLADLPKVALDGELWMGRGRFEETVSAVRRHQPDEAAWREVRLMVFDLPESAQPFGERLAQLRALFAEHAPPYAALIEQFRVDDHDALMAHLERVTDAGGEGLMLHHRRGLYQAGRASTLIKLKVREDAEARVIGHLPGQGKYTGMLGALRVETADGVRFRIGTGFSDAERRTPPPLGAWITFTHQGYTERGIPRFASFQRIRPEGW